MLNIKKILLPMAAVLLFLLFSGCSSNAEMPQEELQEVTIINETGEDVSSTEPVLDIEYKDKNYEPEDHVEIKVVRDQLARFTSTWAKTEEYFFFRHNLVTWRQHDGPGREVEHLLYRLPFDDITQGSRVTLPGEGEIEILGLSNTYLFISRRTGTWELRTYSIYQIDLLTFQPTLIDTGDYYGVPFFHVPSNSILFAHESFEENMIWLEHLQLDTKERNIFFEFETNNFWSNATGWWQMENGDIAFINSSWGGVEALSDFILINHELQAERIKLDEIKWLFLRESEPHNPAEEFIYRLEISLRYGRQVVTIDNWVYYLVLQYNDEQSWNLNNNLYRIKTDGTQNMLLKEDTYIRWLMNINNTIIAFIEPEVLQEDESWVEVVVLSEDGNILKTIGAGWHGHNSGFGAERLLDTDMIMIMDYSFFLVDGSVQGLFCTKTGAFFSSATP